MEQLALINCESIKDKIKKHWANYPEVDLHILEIKRIKELPSSWEKCKKNEIWIGIIRGRKKDKVCIVKHQMEMIIDLKCKFEKLKEKEMKTIGIYPSGDLYCKQCGEFSTRIDIDGRCRDCHSKNKKVN